MPGRRGRHRRLIDYFRRVAASCAPRRFALIFLGERAPRTLENSARLCAASPLWSFYRGRVLEMVPQIVHGAKLSQRCSDENFALGSLGCVVIVIWRRETTLGAVGELTAYIAECCLRHSYGIGLLQVIEDTATPPSSATRRALAHMHSAHAAHIRRSALVYTKSGFAGAAVRMVMTGVAMLHPPAFEHELFGSVRDAIPWLEENLIHAAPLPPGALKAACETLRAAAKGSGAHDQPEPNYTNRKVSPRL